MYGKSKVKSPSTYIPQLHVSISDDQTQIVTRHVLRLAGQQEDAVLGVGPELHAELEVAVGVGQGGQGQVGLTTEGRGGDVAVGGALFAKLAVRTEASFLDVIDLGPGHEALALGATLQVAEGVNLEDLVLVGRGGHGQGPRGLHLGLSLFGLVSPLG